MRTNMWTYVPEKPYSGQTSDLRLLSLCSGVGMLEEGIAAAVEHALGCRTRTVGYCERDSYAAATLLARMEDASLDRVPIWDDIESFPSEDFSGSVDIISAGFPCQPWSCAGKCEGIKDKRWLWPSIVRIIMAVRPRFICLENVPGLVSGGGLAAVLSDFAEGGFDAEWLHLSAGAVGASHQRERVFILAVATDGGRRELWQPSECGGQSDGSDKHLGHTGSPQHTQTRRRPDLREEQGRQCLLSDRRGALANAMRSRFLETRASGPDETRGVVIDRTGRAVADSCCAGLKIGPSEQRDDGETFPAIERGGRTLFAPGPSNPRWPEIVRESPHLAPAVEPGLRVLADGVALVVDAHRHDQLCCVGNGVVALCAAVAFAKLFEVVKAAR